MATRIRNLDNAEGGSSSQHKFVLQYRHSLGKFVLVSSNTLLSRTTDDSDIDDTFVTQLEQEIDKDNIREIDLDGGPF